jgi:hypothetical protein
VTVKADYCTPTLHVADVEQSLRFYARLGFETKRTDAEGGQIDWARAQCEDGALMFNRAEERVDLEQQAVVFYMYTPDLPALREQLLGSGVEVSPVRYPDYLPNGESRSPTRTGTRCTSSGGVKRKPRRGRGGLRRGTRPGGRARYKGTCARRRKTGSAPIRGTACRSGTTPRVS